MEFGKKNYYFVCNFIYQTIFSRNKKHYFVWQTKLFLWNFSCKNFFCVTNTISRALTPQKNDSNWIEINARSPASTRSWPTTRTTSCKWADSCACTCRSATPRATSSGPASSPSWASAPRWRRCRRRASRPPTSWPPFPPLPGMSQSALSS